MRHLLTHFWKIADFQQEFVTVGLADSRDLCISLILIVISALQETRSSDVQNLSLLGFFSQNGHHTRGVRPFFANCRDRGDLRIDVPLFSLNPWWS